MTSSCSFNSLPSEIQLHILSMVPPKDLLACSSVSKQWCTLASDQQLWKGIVERNFKEPFLDTNDWKRCYRLEENEKGRTQRHEMRAVTSSSFYHPHGAGEGMIEYGLRLSVLRVGSTFFGASGLALAGYGFCRLISNLYDGDDPQVSIALIIIGISLSILAPRAIAAKLGIKNSL